MRSSGVEYLLVTALVVVGLAACNRAAKTEGESTKLAPSAAPVEPPPPPEPASALGSASGTLRMVKFAKEMDFWAFDKNPSDANLAKAQGRVDQEFHAAMASWKPGGYSLVIHLFTDNLSPDEVEQFKTAIVNDSDAIRKRAATPGKVAGIRVNFESNAPPSGRQKVYLSIDSRLSDGKFASESGQADLQISILPPRTTWALPGRVLPEVELRTSGKQHYGGSSFGGSEWQIQVHVPVIIRREY
jgi:hypothetical protein